LQYPPDPMMEKPGSPKVRRHLEPEKRDQSWI
jgi:hypothetical protein